MSAIRCETFIAAPIYTCFNLENCRISAGRSLLTVQKEIDGVTIAPMEKAIMLLGKSVILE